MHSATTNRRAKSPWKITDGGQKCGSTKLANTIIRGALTLAVIAVLVLIAARPAQAQSETVLYNFCSQPNCADGANPQAGLTSDGAGNFYGTTYYGGAFGAGTVYELSPNGRGGWNETVLYSFTGGSDGSNPMGPVIFDKVGNLYGTTEFDVDVVFELSPAEGSWTETVLSYVHPQMQSGVMMDPEGNLYGIDGENVFELSPPGWTYQVIYFNEWGGRGGLTMDAAGNIYGVTTGYNHNPKLFALSPNGSGGWNHEYLYGFGKNDVSEGTPVLVPYQGTQVLYGTTSLGPGKKQGTVFSFYGKEKSEYSFKGGDDGSNPYGGLVYAPNGMLYGSTLGGGNYNEGTVYQIPFLGRKAKVLWSFNGTDGSQPLGSLILDSAGNLYGTTSEGGANGNGVVFEVTP